MPVDGETEVSMGAVYDGDGRLVLGSGPTFSLGLVTDCAFQAVLHNLDEPGIRSSRRTASGSCPKG